MFRNYLKIALRVFMRNRVYVAINLLGLGFALSCCLMSYLHFHYRDRFDAHLTNTQQIYRLNTLRKAKGSIESWALSPIPMAEALKTSFPAISQFARLHSGSVRVKSRDHIFNERIHYADLNLFKFFSFPLLQGNLLGFESGQMVVISQSMAKKYFGNEPAMGQELTLLDSRGKPQRLTVGAVLDKLPSNSSFQFDLLTTFDWQWNDRIAKSDDWGNSTMITTFVEMPDARSSSLIEGQLASMVTRHNQARPEWNIQSFYFQPFRDIAYSSDIDCEGYVHGSPLQSNPRGVIVVVPALMSVLLLLITCFNFTNLSLAFAGERLKEIGVRKVMGGNQKGLITQFMTENLLLSSLACGLALLLVSLLLPAFNERTGLALRLDFGQDGTLCLVLLGLPLMTALLAGLYPAVYISAFPPIRVLKGKKSMGSANWLTRLLLGQFSLSCLALVVGIILTHNAAYQQNADFGYALEDLIVIPANGIREYTAFTGIIRSNPEIQSVAGTTQQIADDTYPMVVRHIGREVKAQIAQVGGEDYLNTMGIRLTQGRHFHTQPELDREQNVLVNQTLVRSLGLAHPLGEQIQLDSTYFTIVGVVADYKEFGLHGQVPPCVLRVAKPEEYRYVVVRAGADQLPSLNSYLQASWQQAVPDVPYRSFLQSELVEKERFLNQGFQSVAFFLSITTMLLSASGLFALVSLNIVRRSKEIGMSKVLGASVSQLIVLLNRDFLRILSVAFVLGSTLAYLLVHHLIFRFIYVYHPPIGILPFVLTLVLLLLSGTLTVGWKVYSAASANPIKALKNE